MYQYQKRSTINKVSTPLYVGKWLYLLLRDKIPDGRILDPCSGSGNLLASWNNTLALEIDRGQNFFDYDNIDNVSLVLCNPPWNGKCGSYAFFKHIIKLFGPKIPLVMLVPMGFRLNQKYRSGRWREIRDSGAEINSIVSCPIDLYENVYAHSEILIFNIKGLEPHYWLPEADIYYDHKEKLVYPDGTLTLRGVKRYLRTGE